MVPARSRQDWEEQPQFGLKSRTDVITEKVGAAGGAVGEALLRPWQGQDRRRLRRW